MSEQNLVIDLELGTRLARNQRDLAEELLGVLVKSLPIEMAEILAAQKAHNLEELKRLVHKLHGAVCYCGVPRLKQTLHDLETALKQQGLDAISPHLSQLEIEAGLVVKQASEML